MSKQSNTYTNEELAALNSVAKLVLTKPQGEVVLDRLAVFLNVEPKKLKESKLGFIEALPVTKKSNLQVSYGSKEVPDQAEE